MKCNKCDNMNPEDQIYCLECGEQLSEEQETVQEEQAVEEEQVTDDTEVSHITNEEPTGFQEEIGTKKSKHTKLIAGIVLLIAVGIFIALYANQKPSADQLKDAANSPAEQLPESSQSDQIVVVIGGEEITHPVFNLYFWITQQQFESAGPNIWEMETGGRKTLDIAKENTLDNISLVIAAKQKAEALGLELSKEDQDLVYEQANTIIMNNTELVEKLKFDIKDMERFLKYDFTIQKVVEGLRDNYTPSEDEINTQMEQIKAGYETATVKHVLIASKDEKARELAQEVLNKAIAGEDMAELAKVYSEDPGSKDSGGEYTFPRGQMVPQFEEASFTGEIGKVYPELVETDYGYHIIKVEARDVGALEQIKQDSEGMLKTQYAQDELIKLSKALSVEKTDLYNKIDIIK
ncbi:peptidylprolyl isomerase [Cellulosilyticum sp. I15G10I2]|uniref:peptidylprolyl isomerase n=1 Tax=Cellulosilyticum sp. I15G10I2 TaxID=1892843 RepID=UPI00085C3517|nr:peptidylprolyl isomerase [Cellulosilyticum sp. I15G10I2]